eukprot:TRINITY_DN4557_c0_g1_i1.p1 TRINITY_DN4557_c0_g1~~TRINITY_DN4557_c0_g1_i1.p1  ORF type:complete len:462 (+),score=129.29 TRINITY_DN4557_c0_g1_i1:87-1472(+)
MARLVQENDLVILFESHDKMSVVRIEAGKFWSGRPGTFALTRFIGIPFGSVVVADSGPGGMRGMRRKAQQAAAKGEQPQANSAAKKPRAGWVVVLEPTPDLWTIALSHRTQILYSADISMILLHLEVGPGSVVYESGTGSGSLSYHFINAIAGKKKIQISSDPLVYEYRRGHLFTFEFNGERAKMAVADFSEKLKVGEFVTVTHRDVVREGFRNVDFKLLDQETGEYRSQAQPMANAVFLDLPMPWEVVKFADEVLVSNGKFCSFSPCIEQVQRTCVALAEYKYTEVLTVEVLNRSFEVRDEFFPMPKFDEDDDASAVASADGQGGPAAANQQQDNNGGLSSSEDEGDEEDDEDEVTRSSSNRNKSAKSGSQSPPAKMARISKNGDDGVELKAIPVEEDDDDTVMAVDGGALATKYGKRKRKRVRAAGEPGMIVSHPFHTMRGHTGYLTFARKPVPLGEYE